MNALVKALEQAYPDIEVTVHVLRLIAEFVPYRTWIQEGAIIADRYRRAP